MAVSQKDRSAKAAKRRVAVAEEELKSGFAQAPGRHWPI